MMVNALLICALCVIINKELKATFRLSFILRPRPKDDVVKSSESESLKNGFRMKVFVSAIVKKHHFLKILI